MFEKRTKEYKQKIEKRKNKKWPWPSNRQEEIEELLEDFEVDLYDEKNSIKMCEVYGNS